MKTTKLIQAAIKENKLFSGEVRKTDGIKVKGGYKYLDTNLSGIFIKNKDGLYQVVATSPAQLDTEFIYSNRKELCSENLKPISKNVMNGYFAKKVYLENARIDKANRQKKDIEIIQSFLKNDCQKQVKNLIEWTYAGEYNLNFKKVR